MNSTPYKILIVDDDKFLLNMYSVKFQKENFQVTTAVNGLDALEKLRGGLVPDAIILDIVMPVMDGLECLQNIRKENLVKSSVLIILSNQGQSSDIDKAKQLGINGYIVKATTIPAEVVGEVLRVLNAAKGGGVGAPVATGAPAPVSNQ
jgi:CheY-like chemotaxis protein